MDDHLEDDTDLKSDFPDIEISLFNECIRAEHGLKPTGRRLVRITIDGVVRVVRRALADDSRCLAMVHVSTTMIKDEFEKEWLIAAK